MRLKLMIATTFTSFVFWLNIEDVKQIKIAIYNSILVKFKKIRNGYGTDFQQSQITGQS